MSQLHLFLVLHTLSAVIWIGGMITARLVVHPIGLQFEDMQQRIERNLKVTKRLLWLVFPFAVLSIVTGIVISSGNRSPTVHIKESIWLIMFLNYLFIFYRSRVATRAFNNFDINGARKVMAPIANLSLPINIILGIMAIYFGVSLRGA
jgi:uncharacterized membrane protein